MKQKSVTIWLAFFDSKNDRNPGEDDGWVICEYLILIVNVIEKNS